MKLPFFNKIIKEKKSSKKTPRKKQNKQDQTALSPLENMPVEVLLEIFSMLTIQELSRVSRTSKTLERIADCDFLWKPMLNQLDKDAYPTELSAKQLVQYRISALNEIEQMEKKLFKQNTHLSKMFRDLIHKHTRLFFQKPTQHCLKNIGKAVDTLKNFMTCLTDNPSANFYIIFYMKLAALAEKSKKKAIIFSNLELFNEILKTVMEAPQYLGLIGAIISDPRFVANPLLAANFKEIVEKIKNREIQSPEDVANNFKLSK